MKVIAETHVHTKLYIYIAIFLYSGFSIQCSVNAGLPVTRLTLNKFELMSENSYILISTFWDALVFFLSIFK